MLLASPNSANMGEYGGCSRGDDEDDENEEITSEEGDDKDEMEKK